ncbi:MAG TPA: hypothetical protein PLC54_07765, partial [Spirochaetales bacterium]|nr:hypothetical protein [Spirochaetales bacterium]
MRLSKKSIVIIVSAAFLVLCLALILVLRPKPFTVAYVGLSDRDVAAYAVLFPAGHRMLRMDTAKADAASLTELSADCVLAYRNAALERADLQFAPLDEAYLDAVPPSLARSVQDANGRASAMPIQLDLFELFWDSEQFQALSLAAPESTESFSKALYAYHNDVGPALLFAGGDDETLLSLLGALCISSLG